MFQSNKIQIIELLAKKIFSVCKANSPPYIHCSKINSLIFNLKNLAQIMTDLPPERIKKISVSETTSQNIISILEEFQQLHYQCCRESCAQFSLMNSIRAVRIEICNMRSELSHLFESIGFSEAQTIFELDESEIESQDQVDVRRIAHILNKLRLKKDISSRPDVLKPLEERLGSLEGLGITFNDDDNTDQITISDLPSSLNPVMKPEDIEIDPHDVIGSGQSSKVYKGKIKATGQIVAVKILHQKQLSPFDQEMLRREIFTMSVMSHPSLLRFFGYTAEPPYYLIIEFMENGSLYEFIHERPDQLSATERTLIALDIARGVEYLHSRGIIHRDLKSLNVLLDNNKRAKIADFGLVRFKTMNPMTGLVGTSYWMAPEVLMSSPYYDEKVDVYSFGILMWELLTSDFPYKTELNEKNMTLKILQEGMRPPIPPETPQTLKEFINSCWNSDPDLRPSFHRIVELLADPRYQFPGCKLFLFNQEAGIMVRHQYSLSSPLRMRIKRADEHDVFPSRRYLNSQANNHNKKIYHRQNNCKSSDSSDFEIQDDSFGIIVENSVRRLEDAIQLGHLEQFSSAFNQLEYCLNSSLINYETDWQSFLPRITGAILNDKLQSPFKGQLTQFLFEVIQNMEINIKPLTIISLLYLSDDNVTNTICHYLPTISTKIPCFNNNPQFDLNATEDLDQLKTNDESRQWKELIKILLSYSHNESSEKRHFILQCLINIALPDSSVFQEDFYFAEQIMKFAMRKILLSDLNSLLQLIANIIKRKHEQNRQFFTTVQSSQTNPSTIGQIPLPLPNHDLIHQKIEETNATTILKEVSPSLMKKLFVLNDFAPEESLSYLAKCFEESLHYEQTRIDYSQRLWDFAITHLPKFSGLFLTFKDQIPENYQKMLDIIFHNIEQDEVLRVLIGLCENLEWTKFVSLSLPIKNENQNLLSSLYSELMLSSSNYDILINQPQFYTILPKMISSDSVKESIIESLIALIQTSTFDKTKLNEYSIIPHIFKKLAELAEIVIDNDIQKEEDIIFEKEDQINDDIFKNDDKDEDMFNNPQDNEIIFNENESIQAKKSQVGNLDNNEKNEAFLKQLLSLVYVLVLSQETFRTELQKTIPLLNQIIDVKNTKTNINIVESAFKCLDRMRKESYNLININSLMVRAAEIVNKSIDSSCFALELIKTLDPNSPLLDSVVARFLETFSNSEYGKEAAHFLQSIYVLSPQSDPEKLSELNLIF